MLFRSTKDQGRPAVQPVKASRSSASLRISGFRTRRLARMSDSLVRVSRRVGWGARRPLQRSIPKGRAMQRAVTGCTDDGCRRHLRPPGLGRRHSRQQSTLRAEWRTSKGRSAYGRCASPAPIRFPPGNFKHSLTLFSKSFSSFPRGTCSLSVSRLYLALDGVYRPIWAAFPNNPTR